MSKKPKDVAMAAAAMIEYIRDAVTKGGPEAAREALDALKAVHTTPFTGPCDHCGSSREACDARLMADPKRCCPACKEEGPGLCHKKE